MTEGWFRITPDLRKRRAEKALQAMEGQQLRKRAPVSFEEESESLKDYGIEPRGELESIKRGFGIQQDADWVEIQLGIYDEMGDLVGVFRGRKLGPDAGTYTIAVRESSRRQGFATLLLNSAESLGFDVIGSALRNTYTEEGLHLQLHWLARIAGQDVPAFKFIPMRSAA